MEYGEFSEVSRAEWESEKNSILEEHERVKVIYIHFYLQKKKKDSIQSSLLDLFC